MTLRSGFGKYGVAAGAGKAPAPVQASYIVVAGGGGGGEGHYYHGGGGAGGGGFG